MTADEVREVEAACRNQGVPVTLGKVSGLPFVRSDEAWAYDFLPSRFRLAPLGADGEWLVVIKARPAKPARRSR